MAKQFDIAELCWVLDVSRSGYYSYLRKELRPRREQDRQLMPQIKSAFMEGRKTYGSPRISRVLRLDGVRCGKNRIRRLMKALGLAAVQKKRYRPKTTDSNHRRPVAPNRLLDRAAVKKINEVWVSDITYIPTQEGWLYLAATMDLFSRRVLGWKVQDNLETTLVTEAWKKAVKQRQPSAGLLHHCDRGTQYTSGCFSQLLQNSGVAASMSRKGNCYDNATMESFWSSLKTECLANQIPKTKAQANLMIFDYIETFYNSKRLHSSLGYQSPVDFEQKFNYKN